MTETRTDLFDARRLTPLDAPALDRLTDGRGLDGAPDAAALLGEGAVLGDYAGRPDLQAAAALLPLCGGSELALRLRAAGCGADGQGAVLTPLRLQPGYGAVRRFLRMAVGWATGRYASYHIWAVLPLAPAGAADAAECEELCAQYMAAGFSLRALVPAPTPLLTFGVRPLPRWDQPVRRVHLHDPALARCLERGYAAADFGWDAGGLVLHLRGEGRG